MGWKKVDRVAGESIVFRKIADDEIKRRADNWRRGRANIPVNMESLKAKYFKAALVSQSAEIISASKETVFHLNNTNAKFSNLLLKDEAEVDVASRISNFQMDIIDLQERFYSDNLVELWVKIGISYKNNYFVLEIKVRDYAALGKEIRQKFPQCYIFKEDAFSKAAAEIYGKACENLRKSPKYYFGGWYNLDHEWRFLSRALGNVEADLELAVDQNAANLFLPNFLAVSSEKRKLWVLLLYALWAQLAKFYELENIDGLRTVLYLAAPTGTGKTTLAKIFAKALLTDDAKVELRFDDTRASLQESIIDKKDMICLIDDFYAKGTKLEDAESKSKVSEIMRIVGDGLVKGKMGANRKPLPDRKYRGGLIATGEYIDLNTHSSYLRCWLLNFPANSVHFNENLTLLQKRPDIAKSFISSWVYFLQANQVFILKRLSTVHAECLQKVRKRYPQEYPRFHSNVATFLVVAELFKGFCDQNHLIVNAETIFNAVWQEAEEQLKQLKGISPEAVFTKAVAEALDNAYLRIADCENTFKKYEFDGFYEGEFISVITARLEATVETYANKMQYGIKFTDGLKNSLATMGILEKINDKFNVKYSKNREVEPKRPRMYKIMMKGSYQNE